MSHENYKSLMMGYLDGELTELESQRMRDHLAECRECRAEIEDFRRLKEMTKSMKLATPDDKYWEEYWSHVYNRLERRIGWILLSIGTILLSSYGVYQLTDHLLFDAEIPALIRAGIAALVIGLCTLVVSVVRERIVLGKWDKYTRIKR